MQLGLTPWNFTDLSAASLSRQAVFAEQCGYRSFWLPENHFNPGAVPDPLMLLAGIAAATDHILLATTSYLLTVRHPLQAAEQVAVLDNMSNGRVLLGVGRGFAADMLKAFDVPPKEKRKIFEATLTTMRRAWSGQPIEVAPGVEIVLDPLPLQRPHPPIWVAAFGPLALEQAGRLGMPYIASPMETLATLRENYDVHADANSVARVGDPRVPAVADVPVMRTVFTSEDARLLRQLRERLEAAPSPRQSEQTRLDDWAIVGDGVFVQDKLAEYRESLGVTHVVATRLRIPGVDETVLKSSVARLPELLA